MTHDASHSYTYDAENRVTQVDGGGTATYGYDVDGRRIDKVVAGVDTDYVYDLSGHVVAAYGGGCGNTCWNTGFVYLNGQMVAQYWGGTYFVHADHLGSTRLLTGYPTASVVECDDYYPFGESITCGGTSTTTHKFTGYERDAESNLDNAQARYNSSSLGRFTSPDPTGISLANPTDPQELNLYSYVRNNPLTFVDPTGTNCVWDDGSYEADDDSKYGNTDAGQKNCQGDGGTWDARVTGDWDPHPNAELAQDVQDIQSALQGPAQAVVFGGPNAATQEVWQAVLYFVGSGPKPTIVYQPDDPFSQEFQESMAMEAILAQINSSCSETGTGSVGTFEAFVNTLMDGLGGYPGGNGQGAGLQTPEAQVGAFNFAYSRTGSIANITATNPISLNSAAFHMTDPVGIKNPTSGPFGTVNQEIQMTAAVSPCP